MIRAWPDKLDHGLRFLVLFFYCASDTRKPRREICGNYFAKRLFQLRVLKNHLDDLTSDQVDLWNNHLLKISPLTSPFLTHDFARAVQDVRGGAFVLDIQPSASSRGFLPFQMRRGYSLFGHAEKIGSTMSDHFGVVGNISSKLDTDELLRAAALSSLRFDHASDEIWPFEFSDEEISKGARVEVSDSENYLRMLEASDKDFVKSIARSARQFEREIGPLRFDWDTQYRESALKWLIAVKGHQYKRTGVDNALSAPWQKKLLQRLVTGPALSACRSILSTLTCDGRWIAASLSLAQDSSLHVWFPAYNLAHRKYGPGHLLFMRMFEHASAHGIRSFDFGKGTAAYKLKYQSNIYNLRSGVVRRKTVFGQLDKVFQSLEWRAKQFFP